MLLTSHKTVKKIIEYVKLKFLNCSFEFIIGIVVTKKHPFLIQSQGRLYLCTDLFNSQHIFHIYFLSKNAAKSAIGNFIVASCLCLLVTVLSFQCLVVNSNRKRSSFASWISIRFADRIFLIVLASHGPLSLI